MSLDALKIPVAYRGFSNQSFLGVSSYIEHGNYPADIVFLQFKKGIRTESGFKYDNDTQIKMLYNAIELRGLSYAMKHTVNTKGESGYEKFSNSGGVLKKIVLGTSTKMLEGNKREELFWINCFNMKTNEKIGVPFTSWEMLAFADSLSMIANELETFLYKYQRGIKKNK